MPATITDVGRGLLALIPPVFRDDPTFQAIMEAEGQEMQRFEADLETLFENIFPATAITFLDAFEFFLGLQANPSGRTLAQRRALILTYIQRVAASGWGSEWEASVSQFLGASWTYQEHDPADSGSPDPYVVQIQIPFVPGSFAAAVAETLIRAISPSNLEINVGYSGGFIVGRSAMGDLL